MIPSDFHYAWPSAIYLLILSLFSPLLAWLLFQYRKRLRFGPQGADHSSPFLYWIRTILYSLSFIFCTLALMQPVGNGKYPEEYLHKTDTQRQKEALQLKRKAHDIVLLMDVSASMATTDTPSKKSRLEEAKKIAEEIVFSSRGETFALDAFTSKVSQLSPLTLDILFVGLMIRNLEMNEGNAAGTDLLHALTKVQQSYFSKNTPSLKTLILFSDGEDTGHKNETKEERDTFIIENAKKLFQNASKNHLRVYTIGIGSSTGGVIPDLDNHGKPVTSKLDASLLKAIANIGRGKYYDSQSSTPTDISKDIFFDISQDTLYFRNEEKEISSRLLDQFFGESSLIYQRYFQIPLSIGLFCLAIALLLPHRLTSLQGFLIFMGLFSNLVAIESNREITRAKNFIEAHLYDEARTIYQTLLISPLNEREKAILQYNLAVTYLMEKAWTPAIEILTSIDEEPLEWPFFSQRIHQSLSLAYYGKALQKKENSPSEALEFFELALAENDNPPPQEQTLAPLIKREIAELQALTQPKEKMDSNPLKKSLQILLRDYDRFLKRRSWQQKDWNAIEESYRDLFNVNEASSIHNELTISSQNFQKGIQAYKKNQRPLARLFVENASQWLHQAFAKTPFSTSGNLLNDLTRQQQYALKLTQQLELHQDFREERFFLLKQMQQAIGQLSLNFFAFVYKEQMQAFSNKGLCQASPWDRAFPLFDQGKNAALLGEKILEAPFVSFRDLAFQQSKAISFWQQTLDLLKSPLEKSNSCSNDAASSQNLNRLLQMELDDHLPLIKLPLQTNDQFYPW